MFTNVSMAGVGGIVTIALLLLKAFGIEVPAEAGGQITEAVTTLVGIVLLIWGQVRRPDLTAGLIRKG